MGGSMFDCKKEIPGGGGTRQIAFHWRGGVWIFSGTTINNAKIIIY